MRCSRCQSENPAGLQFCGQCGAPFDSVCQYCGASNPPENRFCGQCGATLGRAGSAKSVLPGEMKQVSVLFCDIVNSTAMAERVGPEAMRDLISSFLDASLAEVRRY